MNRLKTLVACASLAGLLWGLVPSAVSVARADARTDYLVRTLRTSESFRVRVQACLSLGQLRSSSRKAVEALSGALRDSSPAVRTAAATALANLEDPEGLPALRLARRVNTGSVRRAIDGAIMALQRVVALRRSSGAADRSVESASRGSTRPRGPARYYISVGAPGRGNGVSAEMAARAEEALRREIAQIDGVELAPPRQSAGSARQILRRRRLTGYHIDSSIVSVERTSAGTRVQVSLVLGTYPGRDMRAMLRGSATARGAASPSTERAALEGAIRSALGQLSRALTASAATAHR